MRITNTINTVGEIKNWMDDYFEKERLYIKTNRNNWETLTIMDISKAMLKGELCRKVSLIKSSDINTNLFDMINSILRKNKIPIDQIMKNINFIISELRELDNNVSIYEELIKSPNIFSPFYKGELLKKLPEDRRKFNLTHLKKMLASGQVHKVIKDYEYDFNFEASYPSGKEMDVEEFTKEIYENTPKCVSLEMIDCGNIIIKVYDYINNYTVIGRI